MASNCNALRPLFCSQIQNKKVTGGMNPSSVLSSVLGAVSKEAGALLSEEVKLLWGAKENLEKLHTTLTLIQAFLDDAERKQYDQRSVKFWLNYLREVAYDAQDVIDEVATDDLRRKVEAARTNRPDRVSFPSCSAPMPVWFHYRIARKVRSIREKLDWIRNEGNTLGLQQSLNLPSHLLEPPAEGPMPRETSSAVTETRVVGRDQEKANLVELLLSPSSWQDGGNVSGSESGFGFSVVSLIGMGGLGKTTLAQLVYNDERVQGHFDPKVWIHVSAKFDALSIMNEIIESVIKRRSELTSLDGVQRLLGTVLSGKRFLLVLDDVWNEDRQKWKDLCVPLGHGSNGSTVLITTRNQSAADTVAPMTPIKLGILSDDDCWSILQNHVFDDQKMNAGRNPRLEAIGREIAVKTKGVPLAARVLGDLLKSIGLDENRWRDILLSNLLQLGEGESDIMPVLRLSYQHLPPHLKQCFAYSAVFPKGFSLNKDRLVGMWMALGFIQTRGSERIEDVGSDYFNALISRSFFQFTEGRCNMHDLMHDLALSVSEDECFIIEDPDMTKVPKKVLHLTLRTINIEMLENLPKFQKLRSLLFFCKYKEKFTPVLEKQFKQLKKLRVLDLDCSDISPSFNCGFCCFLALCGVICCKCKHPPCEPKKEGLPSSMGSLKQLRYLHLNFKDLNDLPESLGNLYNLQTLIVQECESLNRLPKGMSNLVRLRQLNAKADIVSCISCIGKLASLQGLQKFCVGRENGHKIGELSKLNQISGSLCISKLDNLISREESMEAKLDDKHYISTLILEWSENRDTGSINSRVDEGVLAGLRPHANLKELVIKNNGGLRCIGWMQDQLPPFLETAILSNCTKLEELPPLGLLRFLKVLELRGMAGIVQLNSFKGYPSLEKLVFDDMPNWEEWSVEEECQLFPCLRKFTISNCPQLRGLPPLPPSLENMVIVGAGLLMLPEILGCPLKTEPSSNSSLPLPLSSNADAATEAPSESPISRPFEEIIMQNLGAFNKMKGLLGLSEKDMPSLSPSPSLLSSSCSSLSNLEISKCPNLASLSKGLLQQDLGALRSLRISDCERLVNLPEHGLPSSIPLLIIKRCPLLKDRCLSNGGPDWPKISHIPCIQIDGRWVRGARVGEAINDAQEKLMKYIEEFVSNLFSKSKGQPSESSSSTARGNDSA